MVGIVPGVGWECIEGWLNHDELATGHIGEMGFKGFRIRVDGLSGTETNARQIRDAILALPPEDQDRPLVLIGYSKGAPDILQAIVSYPELRERIVAVISAAGSIGGSPLAIPGRTKRPGHHEIRAQIRVHGRRRRRDGQPAATHPPDLAGA